MANKEKGLAASSASILCEKCNCPMHTRDTRPSEFVGMPAIRRRHHCDQCGHRQTSLAFALPDDVDSSSIPNAVAELLNNYIQYMKGATLGDKLLIMEFTKIVAQSYKSTHRRTK